MLLLLLRLLLLFLYIFRFGVDFVTTEWISEIDLSDNSIIKRIWSTQRMNDCTILACERRDDGYQSCWMKIDAQPQVVRL